MLDPTAPSQAAPSPAPNLTRAGAPAAPDRSDPMWRQAVKLEALLFGQLLEVAGVGGLATAGDGRKDGPGSRFDSFLRQQHAEAVAGSGATGLAAQLYRELKGM